MASTIIPLRPAGIRSSSSAFSAGNRKPDTNRPKSQAWWTPLFGWSSNPDYIDGGDSSSNVRDVDLTVTNTSSSSSSSTSRSKFIPGGFTEEKAKQLRARTLETATFHDKMYHSAIASRLASDVSDR